MSEVLNPNTKNNINDIYNDPTVRVSPYIPNAPPGAKPESPISADMDGMPEGDGDSVLHVNRSEEKPPSCDMVEIEQTERLEEAFNELVDELAGDGRNGCPKHIHKIAAKILDGIASSYITHEDRKVTSIDKRLKLFRDKEMRSFDIRNIPNVSHKALMGNSDFQVELKESMLSNGYENIRLIPREELDRQIVVYYIKDGYCLFSRKRILWECPRKDVDPEHSDYVVKNSTFIADKSFVEALNIDPHWSSLSFKKTVLIERLLDERNDLVFPHSVNYFISRDKPDNIRPQGEEDIMRAVAELKKINNDQMVAKHKTQL
jgi:hypothetical protein